ncbi:MAG: hypothetical protein NTW21_31060 [Verrucomicrobia bacterium]|nr:hypothetical protein [Verrucomicrobiota bacterium]
MGPRPVWRWRPDDTSAAQGLAQRRFIHARLAGRCRHRAPRIEEPGALHGLFRCHDRRAARGRWQVTGTGTLIYNSDKPWPNISGRMPLPAPPPE